MAFMIFTLSLACSMSVCPAMAQSIKFNQHSATLPCHNEKLSDQDQNPGPMVFSDCIGVDLFQADTSVDSTPDLTMDHIDFLWADISATYDLSDEKAYVIRGPPFSDPPHLNDSLLYLTTQRLRI